MYSKIFHLVSNLSALISHGLEYEHPLIEKWALYEQSTVMCSVVFILVGANFTHNPHFKSLKTSS